MADGSGAVEGYFMNRWFKVQMILATTAVVMGGTSFILLFVVIILYLHQKDHVWRDGVPLPQ